MNRYILYGTRNRRRALFGIVLALGVGNARVQGVETDPTSSSLPPTDGIPEGYMIIEEDILVPTGFFEMRGAYATNLWPGGVVPYEFDGEVGIMNKQSMDDAMAEWEAVATVFFVPRDGEADYVYIQNSSGNSSMIGRVSGQQVINIVSWSSRFRMAHELGHALGFWHEQSRLDRGAFVQINWGNIDQNGCSGGSCDSNFDLRDGPGAEAGPYDFDSVMHYGQCTFSACANCPTDFTCDPDDGGITIEVLPPNDVQWQGAIGQRDHLSDWDQRVMSLLYPRWNWVFAHADFSGTELGSLLYPFNTFGEGYAAMPAGGTLWLIWPETYSTGGLLEKPGLIRAPFGRVILDN